MVPCNLSLRRPLRPVVPIPPKRVRPLWIRLLLGLLICIVGLIISAGLVLGYALVVAQPNLPSLDALTDYRPKVPLRIYTADHVLIGEFGEERRNVVHIQDVPEISRRRCSPSKTHVSTITAAST